MRKLVLSALETEDKDIVLHNLAEGNGAHLLYLILNAPFSTTVTHSSVEYSFQGVAVKLSELLAHPKIINTVHNRQLVKLYSTVSQQGCFFETFVKCLQKLLPMSSEHGSQKYSIQYKDCVYSFQDVLEAFLTIIDVSTRLNRKAISYTFWPRILHGILEITRLLFPDGPKTSKGKHILRALDCLFNRVAAPIKPSSPEEPWLYYALAEGPASLNENGPRHDNDKVHFRDIFLFPTAQEVLCPIPLYMPHQQGPKGEYASAWIADTVERNLDIQFRLIREDMVRTFRAGVNAFVQGIYLTRLTPGFSYFDLSEGRHVEGQFFVWSGVQVNEIFSDHRNGLSICFEMDNPALAHQSPEVSRDQAAAMGTRLLKNGALLCLVQKHPKDILKNTQTGDAIYDSIGRPFDSLDSPLSNAFTSDPCWVIITSNDNHNTSSSRVSIQAKPVLCTDIARNLRSMTSKQDDNMGCMFLIEFKGHFVTANQEALESLKTLELHKTPIGPRICDRTPQSSNKQQDHPPEYLTRRTLYDLSFLGKECDAKSRLRNVCVGDVVSFEKLLRDLEQNIILEGTQIDAFVRGLTQEVSLIQGPPGCGKTYIGVQIVRAIVQNRSAFSVPITEKEHFSTSVSKEKPILCVCFTNHALDQFLESLISSGSIKKEGIVRIGSRSSSDIIKERALRKLALHKPPSGVGRYLFGKCKSIIEELRSWGNSLFGSWRGEKFLRWMQENDPSTLESIAESFAEDWCALRDIDTAIEQWVSSGDQSTQQIRLNKLNNLTSKFTEYIIENVLTLSKYLDDAREKLGEDNMQQDLRLLQKASVIGCTTSAAAKYRNLLRALGATVIVCEEAAEVNEGQLLSTLSKSCQHFILIGDHLQLRPKVAEYQLTSESRNDYNLDISLFERLARDHVVQITTLNTQRRMHPQIADLARIRTYPELRDAEAVQKYPDMPRGFASPLYFLSHSEKEDSIDEELANASSHHNAFEVEMITALTRYVIANGYEPNEIAVLTPYLGQLKLIRRRFEEECVSVIITDQDEANLDLQEIADMRLEDTSDEDSRINTQSDDQEKPNVNILTKQMTECVRLATVDKFQGEEADIILISTVRNNEFGSIGFLQSSNRANVMLTRARHGMFILGSSSTIKASASDGLLTDVVAYMSAFGLVGPALPLKCVTHGNEFSVSKPTDITSSCGCNSTCELVLPCGHFCKEKCHPVIKHHVSKCNELCTKIFNDCGHKCFKKCFEPCGKCEEPVFVDLPCGHNDPLPCFQAREENPLCMVITDNDVTRPCGHRCDIRCWENGEPKKVCTEPCAVRKQCGHICGELCHWNGAKIHSRKCKDKCNRALPCGHFCTKECHPHSDCGDCHEEVPDTESPGNFHRCMDVSFSCDKELSDFCSCGGHSTCGEFASCTKRPCKASCVLKRILQWGREKEDEVISIEKTLQKLMKSLSKIVEKRSKAVRFAHKRKENEIDVQAIRIHTEAMDTSDAICRLLVKSERTVEGITTEELRGKWSQLFYIPTIRRIKFFQLCTAIYRARISSRIGYEKMKNGRHDGMDMDQRVRDVRGFIRFSADVWLKIADMYAESMAKRERVMVDIADAVGSLINDLSYMSDGRGEFVHVVDRLRQDCLRILQDIKARLPDISAQVLIERLRELNIRRPYKAISKVPNGESSAIARGL